MPESNASEQFVLSEMTVETAFLLEHLQDPRLRILDVRTAESYEDAHIPGAILLELSSITGDVNDVAGMLVQPQDFAHIMQRAGVNNETAIVLYDDNWGMPAARVLWALQRYGHSNVAILSGGWDQWQMEDLPASTAMPSVTVGNFVCHLQDDHIAEYSWLVQQLDSNSVAIIDTRTPGEFAQGHLPGAVNWDWMNGVPSQGWSPFKSEQEIIDQMAALGITPDMEVVTYCRSGARAAHTYVILRRSGFQRVRNYDGSWLEWSQRQP